MNIDYNNNSVYRNGLIKELLLRSYEGIANTSERDRESFAQFDAKLSGHPEWLGVNVYITSVDGVPVGFVSFDPRKKPVAEIGHNCILPEYRGEGLGVEQMKHALDDIKRQGFTKVIVSTGAADDFISAQKMYLACGFTETGKYFRKDNGAKMIGYELIL